MTLKWTWYPMARMTKVLRTEVRYQLIGIRELNRRIIDFRFNHGAFNDVLFVMLKSRVETADRILQECNKPKMAAIVRRYAKLER